MPSKVLISTANRMFDIQNAQEVALDVSANINTNQVMQHVQNLRDRFTQATLKDVDQWPTEHKISGKAHFIDAQTVEVNGKQYKSKSFILAVGSTPNYDQIWKQELGNRLGVEFYSNLYYMMDNFQFHMPLEHILIKLILIMVLLKIFS